MVGKFNTSCFILCKAVLKHEEPSLDSLLLHELQVDLFLTIDGFLETELDWIFKE